MSKQCVVLGGAALPTPRDDCFLFFISLFLLLSSYSVLASLISTHTISTIVAWTNTRVRLSKSPNGFGNLIQSV